MPFSGSSSSETLKPIFSKFGRIDYICDVTPHANIETNPVKGAVATHA